MEARKMQAIQDFHKTAKQVLYDDDLQYLYKILKTYQRRRRVDRLVDGILSVLRSREKLRLIHYIRRIIPQAHVEEFDRLLQQYTSRRRNGKQTHLTVDGKLTPLDAKSLSSLYSERLFDEMSLAAEVEVIIMHKDPNSSSLGCSIRGGSEHGLGLYISDIEKGSVADVCGLEVGDKLLEVNNISFKNLASSSAVKVLTGSNQLKLVVEKTGQVPEWRLSKEKIAWFDSNRQKLVRGDFEECGTTNFIRGLDVDVPERRVTLESHGQIGFNIRGGNEYGLGIYVSSIDKGGEAERQGVHVGDQIIDVNGIPFENIPHANAVDILKAESHLIMTLRDVGRYPAYKELYAEYAWKGKKALSDKGSTIGKMTETKLQDLWIESDVKTKNPLLHRKVPVEVLSQKSQSTNHSDIYATFHNKDGLPMQSEIYLPQGQGHSMIEDDDLDDDDDLDSVAIDMWTKREGFQNPGYIPDYEQSELRASRSDTDDESGIHGEYMVTMDDIIAREDNFECYSHTVGVKEAYLSSGHRNEKHSRYQKSKNKNFRRGSDSGSSRAVKMQDEAELSDDDAMYMSHHDNTDDEAIYIPARNSSKKAVIEDDGFSDSSHTLSKSPSPAPEKPKRTKLHSPTLNTTNNTDCDQFKEMVDVLDSCSAQSGDSHEDLSKKDSDCSSFCYSSTMSSTNTDITYHGDKESKEIQTSALHHFNIPPPPTDPAPQPQIPARQPIHVLPKYPTPNSSLDKYEQGTSPGSWDTSYNHSLTKQCSEGFEMREEECCETQDVLQNFDDQLSNFENDESHKSAAVETASGSCQIKRDSVDYGNKLDDKSGKWKAIKEKLKGSLRMKSASLRARLKRSKPIDTERYLGKKFENIASGPGRMMHKTTVTNNSIKILEESGKKLLTEEETKAIITHVKDYLESHDIDQLISVLLNLLDKPEKILLLRDVRGVVYPVDMYRFEQKVNAYEIEAYEKLSTKLHLHLNHEKDRKPKRHLLHTEIDEHGHFYIKPVDQFEKEQKTKQKVIDIMMSEMNHPMAGAVTSLDRQESFFGSEHSSSLSHDSNTCDTITAYISKNKPTLGLCVSGGAESKKQPQIKVESIVEGGSASDESKIKPGMVILSIDGRSLVGATHKEAVNTLTECFNNKRKVNMKIVLQSQSSSEI